MHSLQGDPKPEGESFGALGIGPCACTATAGKRLPMTWQIALIARKRLDPKVCADDSRTRGTERREGKAPRAQKSSLFWAVGAVATLVEIDELQSRWWPRTVLGFGKGLENLPEKRVFGILNADVYP